MDVAVKFVHVHANKALRDDMMQEIEFLKHLGKHENLLVMVGYVKDPESPVIATGFCANRDLLRVLRKHDLHYMVGNRIIFFKRFRMTKNARRLRCVFCSKTLFVLPYKCVRE